MMDALGAVATVVGLGFFAVGAVGVLRFHDLFTRLHALTKADNVGLAFICLGAALHIATPQAAAKLLLIWLLTAISSASVAQLVGAKARAEHRR